MCGRRAGAQADRGNAAATRVLVELCPWLFKNDASVVELLEGVKASDVAATPSRTAEAELAIEPPSTASPPE
jgi:hypothetical protein